ncbi:MAG: hypothetical protein H0U74_08690 [Bradymonadaceae bacterium]|nr:hypothetical protein [Lujinxingiaceae bacterium]
MSKSLWKELGEEAAKKAVGTFVGEGIKAVLDIWKARHIKELDVEFKARDRALYPPKGDVKDAPKEESKDDAQAQ